MTADWKRKRPLTDAQCPACRKPLSLPAKTTPVRADIRCPHCRAELTAQLGGMRPIIASREAVAL